MDQSVCVGLVFDVLCEVSPCDQRNLAAVTLGVTLKRGKHLIPYDKASKQHEGGHSARRSRQMATRWLFRHLERKQEVIELIGGT